MFACPQCNAPGIPARAKFHATAANPATCAMCGAFAAEPRWLGALLLVVWVASIVVAINVAIHFIHWWPFPAALFAMCLIETSAWAVAPLAVVDPDRVGSSRRKLILFAIAIVVGVAALLIVRELPIGTMP